MKFNCTQFLFEAFSSTVGIFGNVQFSAKVNLLFHKDISPKFYEFLYEILENILVKFELGVLKLFECIYIYMLKIFQEIFAKIVRNIKQNVLNNIPFTHA